MGRIERGQTAGNAVPAENNQFHGVFEIAGRRRGGQFAAGPGMPFAVCVAREILAVFRFGDDMELTGLVAVRGVDQHRGVNVELVPGPQHFPRRRPRVRAGVAGEMRLCRRAVARQRLAEGHRAIFPVARNHGDSADVVRRQPLAPFVRRPVSHDRGVDIAMPEPEIVTDLVQGHRIETGFVEHHLFGAAIGVFERLVEEDVAFFDCPLRVPTLRGQLVETAYVCERPASGLRHRFTAAIRVAPGNGIDLVARRRIAGRISPAVCRVARDRAKVEVRNLGVPVTHRIVEQGVPGISVVGLPRHPDVPFDPAVLQRQVVDVLVQRLVGERREASACQRGGRDDSENLSVHVQFYPDLSSNRSAISRQPEPSAVSPLSCRYCALRGTAFSRRRRIRNSATWPGRACCDCRRLPHDERPPAVRDQR